ncbi:MAG: hypothetical protein ACO1NZ_13965 [Adhaeribacter sp.]
MHAQALYKNSFLTIQYDVLDDYMSAIWTGEQTGQSIMEGCELILRHLEKQHCHKVLNDNTQVKGMWADTADWVANNWLPRMQQAGCQYFAHVYSPDLYSRLSADKSFANGVKDLILTTFQEKGPAQSWLKAM